MAGREIGFHQGKGGREDKEWTPSSQVSFHVSDQQDKVVTGCKTPMPPSEIRDKYEKVKVVHANLIKSMKRT